MEPPLLSAKLFIPRPRPGLVPRPRLIDRMRAALGSDIVLVSAPAGYGKTTFVLESIRELEKPAGWVSLDSGDNIPTSFLSYFIRALQNVIPGACQPILAAMQSSQPPPTEWLLTGIINSVSEFKDDFVIVLDDYHTIESAVIHEALSFLVEHLPTQIRLVVAGRIDPPLPLARWRLKGKLAEIRAADLSFTPEEATALIQRTTGIDLSAPDLAALERRTEGWVAGLKMAALSLQNKKDVSGYIRSFSGSNRYIMDYLAEEVLNQQPSNIRQFLLETSILDRLCASLCIAVTDRKDSQDILDQMERANLFISTLDDKRSWYRYHQLFATILRNQLVKSSPERMNLLHHRASVWYEQNGLTEDAVEHALLGNNAARAADLLEIIAPSIIGQGQALRLLGYRTRVPQSLIASHPWLCISFAWAALLSHQWDLLSTLLSQANAALSVSPDRLSSTSQQNLRHIQGHLLSIQGYLAQAQGDIVRSIRLSEQANQYLPADDLMTLSANSINIAIDYLLLGEMTKAVPYFEEANKSSTASGNSAVRLSSQAYIAEIELQRSHFEHAVRICSETIELGTRLGGDSPLPYAAIAFILLGQLQYERDDLENAARNLTEGIRLAEDNFNWTFLLKGCLTMAKLVQAQGNSQAAIQFLQRAEEAASKAPQARESRQVPAWKALLALRRGDVAAALDWARQQEDSLPLSNLPGYLQEFDCLTLVRVKLAKGEYTALAEYLVGLIRRAENQGRSAAVIEMLILKALSLEGQRDIAEAVETLDYALSLAEPAGYVRTFVDEGDSLSTSLRKLVGDGRHIEYASRLLNLVIPASQDQSGQSRYRGIDSGVIEALSEREVEILKLIALGKSNRAIASELYLAVGTVKRHVYNIFGKLGVDSRTQAVARARELRLLND